MRAALPLLPITTLLLLALSAQAEQAPAAAKDESKTDAKKTEKLDRVDVDGKSSDEAAREASTAAKIVIGREELLRYGDSSVSELMKRLPGVTTGGVAGRGGDIRMRGMAGGYTQILVNGERMPPGFSLETLPPEQLERIEVMRAPTAEFGARAIAGTINIVLRQAPPKLANELRAGVTVEHGHATPNVNWSRNDKLDEAGKATYNITVNAQQFQRGDESRSSSATQDLTGAGDDYVLASHSRSESSSRALNLNGRLQWRPANGESIALMPFLASGDSSGSSRIEQARTPVAPAGDPLARFDTAASNYSSRYQAARLGGQWQTVLGKETKLDASAGVGRFSNSSESERHEFLAGVQNREQRDTTEARNRNWSLRGKLSQPLMEQHSLVGGLEAEGTRMNQDRHCTQDGQDCAYLADFGDTLHASTRRVAAYAQDDWSVGRQWAFYAGLRWEAITTDSTAANYAVSNTSHVITPLLHALYKLSDDPKQSRGQIRLSLTRSYRSPDLNDLIARPSINAYYPCLPGTVCGGNEYLYADYAGNPALKPELATGIDLAWEQYLSKGGVLSANLFARRLENVVRRQTQLETVDWSPVPRWVSRPRNIGTAWSSGLELEAKFRLDQFLADALPINLRTNLSLYRSAVDSLPGPDNRLAQQPRYTANLGADYKLRGLPLSLGASLNYTPVTPIRQSPETLAHLSKKQVFDAYAAWSFDMNTALRLSATNLSPQDYRNESLTTLPDRIVAGRTVGRTFTVWALRLEMKV